MVSVDRVWLNWFLLLDKDVVLWGEVVFVGMLSMVIRMEADDDGVVEDATVDDDRTELVLVVDFIFVVRDLEINKLWLVNLLVCVLRWYKEWV